MAYGMKLIRKYEFFLDSCGKESGFIHENAYMGGVAEGIKPSFFMRDSIAKQPVEKPPSGDLVIGNRLIMRRPFPKNDFFTRLQSAIVGFDQTILLPCFYFI